MAALVQDVGFSGNPAPATSHTFTLTATGTGNTLTVTGDLYSGIDQIQLVSVTDNGGNTWQYSTSAASDASPPNSGTANSGSNWFVSFVAYCIAANPVTTVTVTWNTGDIGGATLDVSEFSGITAYDTSIAGTGTSTATTPGSITLAGAGELAVGAADYLGTLSSSPSGATRLSAATGAGVAAYEVFGSGGSQSFAWTLTGSALWSVAAAAFKATGSLQVTTLSLPAAVLSHPYSATLQAASGTPPYTWSISSGSLPSWASLNSSTGVISGTAPGGGTGLPPVSFTAEVTDSAAGTATQALTLGGAQPAGSPDGGPWTLVFAEEFDYPVDGPVTQVPDPAVWTDHILWGDVARSAQGDGGAGSDCGWAPHNKAGLSVAGSILSITVRNESPYDPASAGYDPACPNPTIAGVAASYTSGILSSAPGFAWTYGYAEALIKIPAGVSAIHPAFWSDSRTGAWGPEIDIQEYASGANTCTLWSLGEPPSQLLHTGGPTSDGGWHTWGVRWSASDVTYFCDGSQFATYTTAEDITYYPAHIYLNFQVDADVGGTGYPCQYQVDYVRVWTVSGAPAQPAVTSVSPPSGIPASNTLTVAFDTSGYPGGTTYRAVAFPVDMYADSLSQPGAYYAATGSSSPLTISAGIFNGSPSAGPVNGARYAVSVSAISAGGVYSIESLPVPALPQSPFIQPSGLTAGGFP